MKNVVSKAPDVPKAALAHNRNLAMLYQGHRGRRAEDYNSYF